MRHPQLLHALRAAVDQVTLAPEGDSGVRIASRIGNPIPADLIAQLRPLKGDLFALLRSAPGTLRFPGEPPLGLLVVSALYVLEREAFSAEDRATYAEAVRAELRRGAPDWWATVSGIESVLRARQGAAVPGRSEGVAP